MQRIFFDLTNLLKVRSLTGIQRVVRNVLREMQAHWPGELCYLTYSVELDSFARIGADALTRFLQEGTDLPEEALSAFSVDDFHPGDVFFDLDAVWNNDYKRSSLLPLLKSRGVRVAVYVYDIIPVIYPQFSYQNTVSHFLNYLGAHLQYADLILVSAEATKEMLKDLEAQLGLPEIPCVVCPLGADFIAEPDEDDPGIPPEVRALAGKRYILSVGTIEPRKNHRLLLDAYDRALGEMGVELVFAGKRGWNVDELMARIERTAEKSPGFHHFIGLPDAAIDFLYRHAFLTAFPTFMEGFGLPIVESLQRGTPVIASDIPVLREVGGDACVYFPPEDPEAFLQAVRALLEDPSAEAALRGQVKTFVPLSWEEAGAKIMEALKVLFPAEPRKPLGIPKQMVLLSARADDVGPTLVYVDKLMPFIREVLICCPDDAEEAMRQAYSGRLAVTTLTDSAVCAGEPVPKDHTTRNFWLRCKAMQSPLLDDVFLMSDDDYRPLREITPEDYLSDGAYNAYYFYDITRWLGTVGSPTSYDSGHYRTAAFLQSHHYPTLQYSSHMPQIIEKGIFLELIAAHPGIEYAGYDEWSAYFNYAQYRYPELIRSRPFVTLGWPASGSDWRREFPAPEYVFENFYDFLYEDGRIFAGLSKTWPEDFAGETAEKIRRYEEKVESFTRVQKTFDGYAEDYRKEFREPMQLVIRRDETGLSVIAPRYLTIPKGGFIRLPAYFGGLCEDIRLSFKVRTRVGAVLMNTDPLPIPAAYLETQGGRFELPMRPYPDAEDGREYRLEFIVEDASGTWSDTCRLIYR